MKKLFTLKVNNYRPELCKVTTPTQKTWAEKNGWQYHEITERSMRKLPVTAEKLQVHELLDGLEHAAFVDADIMIRPDFECPTTNQERGIVWASYGFDAVTRFTGVDGFGISGGFYGTSKESFKLWDWPDWKEAVLNTKENPHLIDEWVIAYNLNKHKLQYNGVSHFVDSQIVHFGSELIQNGFDLGVEQASRLWQEWVTIWPEIKMHS
jgi:hypothetical protein